jgi:hypothetical protein
MPNADEIERIEQQVNAELPEIMERQRKKKVAREEQSVSGQLRRAIHDGNLRYPQLVRLSGVSMEELDDFMTGEPVPLRVFEQLAAAMKCQLVTAE